MLPDEVVDGYGVEMRLVPAGQFTIGSDQSVEEQPVHTVFLDSFYMDKYEVTNLQYQTCVDAGVCAPPKSTKSFLGDSYYGAAEFNNYPVITVDWNMAKAYCEWRGARLPTEAEWEKSARGTDARRLPWGNAFDGNRLNYCDKKCVMSYADPNYDDGYVLTSPVGNYEEGKSQFGVYDLAGNVMEWAADWFSATYYQYSPESNPLGPTTGEKRLLLGESWAGGNDMRSSYRTARFPNFFNFDIGFRCAKSVNP